MRVGFIGVGNIGHPMASQLLQAGYALVVHDLRPEAAASSWRLGLPGLTHHGPWRRSVT